MGDESSDGCGSVGPQQPEPDVTFGLGGCAGRFASPRERPARAKNRQRLPGLKELGEAGAFAAVRHLRIRIRDPGKLLAADHLRFRTNGPGLRSVAHDELHDFALGSVLAGGNGRHASRPAAAIQVQTWARVGINGPRLFEMTETGLRRVRLRRGQVIRRGRSDGGARGEDAWEGRTVNANIGVSDGVFALPFRRR